MSLGRAARAWVAALWSEDRAASVLVCVWAATQLASVGWDLPSTHGWENDAVAPLDLFAGVAQNLASDEGHTYPLFHQALLLALSAPVLLVGALGADSSDARALTEAVVSTGTMTAVALVARTVTVTMGSVTLLVLGRIARRIGSVAVARWTVAFAGLNLAVSYYGRTANLDGPYLLWTALALDRLLDVAERGRRADYALVGLFVALAVATKDQAYASFALVLPIYLYLLRPGVLPVRELRVTAGVAALAYVAASGALLNPTGFVGRVSRLVGPSSEDWRTYARSADGLARNLRDLAADLPGSWWPGPVLALVGLGIVAAVLEPSGDRLRARAFRLLPLAAAAGSVLAFTLVVGRTGHRFVLPAGLWMAFYAGIGIELVRARARGAVRPVVTGAGAALVAVAGLCSLGLHLTQAGDARFAVERFLDGLPEGTVVETYGKTVYLPRFDGEGPYRVERVGAEAVGSRSPLPAVREVESAYGDVQRRAPDVLVVPEGFAIRFLHTDSVEGGRVPSAVGSAYRRNDDATRFFRAATSDRLPGYSVVSVVEPRLPEWATLLGIRPVVVHGSTGRRVWLLVRSDRVDDLPATP